MTDVPGRLPFLASKLCLVDIRQCGKCASIVNRLEVITRHLLVRAKGEVLVLLHVFWFVRFFVNDFSTTRGPIHAKFCMRTYSAFRCVFSPFGGQRPREAEKGEMKFSSLQESMGNFCILMVFERYLSNAWTDPHQILSVQGQCLPNGGFVSVLLTHLFSCELDNTRKTFKNSTYLGKATEVLPPVFTENVYFADLCHFASVLNRQKVIKFQSSRC